MNLTSERKDLYQHLNKNFVELNKNHKSSSGNEISDAPIQQSSLKPAVIPGKSFQYTESMQSFCTEWILNRRGNNIISDSRSKDIFIVPLNSVVCSHDRVFITKLASERSTLPSKDGHIHLHRYYACFCSNLYSPQNKCLRDVLVKFMDRYFESTSSKLMAKVLSNKSKSMNSIIVFDRCKQKIPHLVDHASICSAIIFSIEKLRTIIYISIIFQPTRIMSEEA